jgi:hypothetical protein
VIPWTTTIDVLRTSGTLDGDGYDEPSTETIARGVKAHISAPSGSEAVFGLASSSSTTLKMNSELTDLLATDMVLDNTTGYYYSVVHTQVRTLLPHRVSVVQRTTGGV